MARRLGMPWALASAALVVPAAIRDVAYRVIARNRLRWFGQRDTCRIPTPGEAGRFL
jgi:predicted DCC family thiol-disulfide oxidoreductase YuxK